ncbi:hypothetical protein GOODEAATRI_024580 [Goodea atripinnis]|uniref:Uncharacterized protein n=1 Tax=Goodea atripinnis TaxID=208336 RepID=A0ABV0NYR4_9TELE
MCIYSDVIHQFHVMEQKLHSCGRKIVPGVVSARAVDKIGSIRGKGPVKFFRAAAAHRSNNCTYRNNVSDVSGATKSCCDECKSVTAAGAMRESVYIFCA